MWLLGILTVVFAPLAMLLMSQVNGLSERVTQAEKDGIGTRKDIEFIKMQGIETRDDVREIKNLLNKK